MKNYKNARRGMIYLRKAKGKNINLYVKKLRHTIV